MDYEHLLVEIEDRVMVITMNRPEVLNAMNHKLDEELYEAVMAANADDGVGCIVITGAGNRAFSAGGDIHEQREHALTLTEEQREADSLRYQQWMYEISASPKPVIGMMNGLAYGGGAVLASCLDMRVGCENTRFRFLAVAYGRINSTWTLTNQVGWPMAKEYLLTGRVVDAEEAYRVGLLNHLVSSEELREKNHGDRRHYRRPPTGVGNWHKGDTAARQGRRPAGDVGKRARLHQRGKRLRRRTGLPRVHRPPGAGTLADTGLC